MKFHPRLAVVRSLTLLMAAFLAGTIAGCSGSADGPQQLGAGETHSLNSPPLAAPGTSATSVAVTSAGQAIVAPAKSAAVVEQRPAASTTEQRCMALRQEGTVWERTRKLAVLNRGEAGGRMADLHTPWTKENVTFYLTSCQGRRPGNRLPAQARASTDVALNR